MSAYTVPAIKGQMGSTSYYQAVMRADELASTVHAAVDFPEFEHLLESERMQRALSEERVEREIVPYLTKSPDRFFGSVIVLVYEPKRFTFESLADLGVGRLGASYQRIADSAGALTISGGKLFALDGQHRLHALRTVIAGGRTPRLKLPVDGPFAGEVGHDELSVIFIPFESSEKARRIFTKVNRYAKPVTKANNILMSEDDGHAIVARCLGRLGDPFDFDSDVNPPLEYHLGNGCRTVQAQKNNLSTTDHHFTTLEVLYSSVPFICKATNQLVLDEKVTVVRPDDSDLKTAYEDCALWWGELMGNFKPFKRAATSRDFAAFWRDHDMPDSLAYRPVGQEAIIQGMMLAHQLTGSGPSELVDRLNRIEWCLGRPVWEGILLGGGDQRRRIINSNVSLAGRLIAYRLAGADSFGAARTSALLVDYRASKAQYGIDARELPRPVV